MSQENVEMVRRFYDAWNRRDFDEAAAFVDDDFELHVIGGLEGLMGREFIGREGLLRFSREIAATVGGQVVIERIFDLGERVALVANLQGSGAGSGAPSSTRIGQILTFRDARVIRVESYYGPQEALEAAGLRG